MAGGRGGGFQPGVVPAPGRGNSSRLKRLNCTITELQQRQVVTSIKHKGFETKFLFPHVRPIRANFRENYQENLPLLKHAWVHSTIKIL